MSRALFHAARGRGRTSPNPMVGAVVVSPDGLIVGDGYHHKAGGPHAEVNALEAAGERARGATLYCTLEPCCHVGRTGACVRRIVAAGITRVVASIEDPNPMVNGGGFEYLLGHGIDVQVGLGAEEAERLNQPFFTLVREERPFVILKAAVSADGFIAKERSKPTRLTSPSSDRHAQLVRAEVDAIGIGSGTILSDDPELTARGPFRERPLARVIFDRRLRTPPAARVLSTRTAGPVIIMTSAASARRADLRKPLEARGAEIEVTDDGTIAAGLRRLGSRSIESLLLEGGAELHAAAWDERLVDFVRLYRTPHVLASGVAFLNGRAFSADDLIERRTHTLGVDTVVEGYVHGPH
jgi:diaminohydroxyphosphoribosylaminopyrimidine deaminase/5-amino-6-(5-phosphoribosylamino)uracil reductase